MNDWPHQIDGVEGVENAIAAGQDRVLLTSPTGMGKTRMVAMLVKRWRDRGKRVIFYTNRRALFDQLSDDFAEFGLYHGLRAAGEKPDHALPFQIASIQTEHSKVNKTKQWYLYDADYVVMDEAHSQTGPTVETLLNQHREAGAKIVGISATPLDLVHMYDRLIVAGRVSDGFKCGALIPAHHFGPDEPDIKRLKRKPQEGKDLSENQNRELYKPNPKLFGRIWGWFEQLNPERRSTIAFAAGVRESIWLCEQFAEKGVKFAHIDGEHCWIDGELQYTTPTLRKQILDASKAGDIVGISNRFVMREGMNLPWLSHGIFATIFGSLQTYLQAGGRLLRSFPGMDYVTIQDHGGNWWRHGSLNADRDWLLEMDETFAYGLRAERIRSGKEPRPKRCPACSRIVTSRSCPCGFEFKATKTSKPVFTADGEMKEMVDSCFRVHTVAKPKPANLKRWEDMYWRSRKADRTFRAAMALYAMEMLRDCNYFAYPDERWPLMPVDETDFFRSAALVPMHRLIQKPDEPPKPKKPSLFS